MAAFAPGIFMTGLTERYRIVANYISLSVVGTLVYGSTSEDDMVASTARGALVGITLGAAITKGAFERLDNPTIVQYIGNWIYKPGAYYLGGALGGVFGGAIGFTYSAFNIEMSQNKSD